MCGCIESYWRRVFPQFGFSEELSTACECPEELYPESECSGELCSQCECLEELCHESECPEELCIVYKCPQRAESENVLKLCPQCVSRKVVF